MLTPESIAADYRRMAESARAHGRLEWSDHWEARADQVIATRKISLTEAERRDARLEQREAWAALCWHVPTAARGLRKYRRGRVA